MAILSAAYGMWRSGLFSVPLNVIGAISGIAIIGAQFTVAPSLQSRFDILAIFPILFWIWMVSAGVVCWRRTG